MSPLAPISGFAPDADPTQAGVVTDCTSMVPTLRGLAGAPSQAIPAGVGVLASDARGAGVTVSTTGTRRLFAGTQTKLYELITGTWTDISRAGNYVGATDNRWMFAQFGNATIATNDVEAMQASLTGAFSDIAAAPKARIVIAAANFVIALNTNDATYGDQSDRWWCSAFQDYTSWAPSVTTQATTGRLIGDGGEITAACRLGQQVVAYKARSLFLGTYVGPPVVWQWDQVPGEVGCVGPEAVADVGGAHVFVGEDNIWLYDGTRPVPIAEGLVRQWFFDQSSPSWRFKTIVSFDRQNNRVWIYFPSKASTTGQPDMALVYHLGKKAWGRADQAVQAALNYVAQGTSFDTAVGTFDGQLNLAYDSQYWLAGGRSAAIVNSSGQLVTLTGASTTSSLTTGDMGDDDGASMLRRARLRFLAEPTSASAVGFTKSGSGNAPVSASSATMTNSGFDLRQSARWHRIRFSFVGDVEVSGVVVDAVAAGKR